MLLSGQNIKSVFAQEFSLLDDSRNKFLLVLFCAIFSTAFIFIYNPLNIANVKLNTQLGNTISIYSSGVVGAAVLLFTQFVLRPLCRLNKLSIGSYLLWTSFEFVLICLVIFSIFGERGLPIWDELLLTSRFAIFLSLLPYSFSCLLVAVLNTSQPVESYPVRMGQDSSQHIVLKDENDKPELILRPSDLIYLKANDNYVQVFYLNGDKVDKKLIRTRLKKLETILSKSKFTRIHRSYIINRDHIQHINRIGSKLALRLSKIEDKDFLVTPTYRGIFQENFAITT